MGAYLSPGISPRQSFGTLSRRKDLAAQGKRQKEGESRKREKNSIDIVDPPPFSSLILIAAGAFFAFVLSTV